MKLVLFIAGGSERSRAAVRQATALCRGSQDEALELDIVDVYDNPARAARAGIPGVPALVRTDPQPQLRVVGTLGDIPNVRRILGLATTEVAAGPGESGE